MERKIPILYKGKVVYTKLIDIPFRIKNVLNAIINSTPITRTPVFTFMNESYIILDNAILYNSKVIFKVNYKENTAIVYDMSNNFIKKKLKYLQDNIITTKFNFIIELKVVTTYSIYTNINDISQRKVQKFAKAAIELL